MDSPFHTAVPLSNGFPILLCLYCFPHGMPDYRFPLFLCNLSGVA